eukprot:1877659-Pyramimonas_sp.AAC.1
MIRGVSLYQECQSNVAPFQLRLVSLPADVSTAPSVYDLVDQQGCLFLEGCGERMLRDISEFVDLRRREPVKPCSDPRLGRSRRRCLRFIRRLRSIGMLRCTTQRIDFIGSFFVWKK